MDRRRIESYKVNLENDGAALSAVAMSSSYGKVGRGLLPQPDTGPTDPRWLADLNCGSSQDLNCGSSQDLNCGSSQDLTVAAHRSELWQLADLNCGSLCHFHHETTIRPRDAPS